ncbi:retropepsin-like aspartic protease family protein [Phaeovulum sp. W22_SRMD_FR3]|uniref:retropepsin-like aspartic protease family protein n=1 Tax=Phaeovulum sp. W22_SRMD_FR3 TaxID=3240274 RepID=UPI003F959941
MSGDMLAQLGYFSLILIAVGGYVVAEMRRRPGRVLQQALVWGLIFVGVIGAAGLWDQISQKAMPRQSAGEGGQIELPLGRDGHFHLTAVVNGQKLNFTVDTGASDIVLSRDDARRVGINPDMLSYFGQAQTANGVVATAPVTLDSFTVEGVTDSGLRAVVNNGPMDGSLLGMRYLSRFSNIQMQPDRMILTR